MQQRQPRLGDIVDDYCPRERRITNHAVVAMVGDAVKQTRCATCDADHEYKHAKVPPQRRKKEEGGVLYQQVLAGMPRKAPGIPVAGGPDDASDLPPEPPVSDEPHSEPDAEPLEANAGIPDESVHRPLIRATLPRLTDEPPQRREPEFTMRAPQQTRPGKFGRGGFRGGRPGAGGGQGFGGNGGANGHRSDGQKRHGQGPGQRPGNFQGGGRPGQSQGNRHGRPGGGPGQGHGHGHGPGRGGKKSPR